MGQKHVSRVFQKLIQVCAEWAIPHQIKNILQENLHGRAEGLHVGHHQAHHVLFLNALSTKKSLRRSIE